MTVSRSICLGFLAAILIGAGLLLLPISTTSGEWNSPIVALFTATSAVCVTGHIVVDTGSYFFTPRTSLYPRPDPIGRLGLYGIYDLPPIVARPQVWS